MVAKPSGTRTPAAASWLIISPSEEFLPPTESTSDERNSMKSMTLACSDMDAVSFVMLNSVTLLPAGIADSNLRE